MLDYPKPSAWNVHPSQNSTGLYKFVSWELNLNQRIQVTTRLTYDFLSWLGDCGGLKDGIFWIGSIIMHAYSAYNMNTLLLTTVFRVNPSDSNSSKFIDSS